MTLLRFAARDGSREENHKLFCGLMKHHIVRDCGIRRWPMLV
jgi:hypothetical protein